MPLISEAWNIHPENTRTAREHEYWTTCSSCEREVRLHKATVEQTDPLETIYRCPQCGGVILIISTPGVVAWEGRGYRWGDWMVRNPSDLYFQGLGMEGTVLTPASPHALD